MAVRMRPFKHATPTQSSTARPEFQNILGISLTRFAAPWGEVPIVATTERDRITLLYWDDRAGRWEAAERPHESIRSDGSSPDAPPLDRHGGGVVRPGRDGAGQPARRSRSIRSSMGGWVMNKRISPRRVAPEMPKAAIWSGKGSRP